VRIVRTIIILGLIFCASPLFAGDELLDAGRVATIDYMLERAVSQGFIGGGVVLIGNHAGVTHTASHGRINQSTEAGALNERTIFDIASLTKVVATAPAVMKLLEEGRISLLDPITQWFPEFEDSGRDNITVLNLLTHTSGLNDTVINYYDSLSTTIQKVAQHKNGRLPGSHFLYADINFILLAELVQRVSGVSIDRYCRENFYGPLGMGDTMFLPPHELINSIAPTLGPTNELLSGVVQDQNARHMGGIAGHAGLFSSASDLSRYATMILNNGRMQETQILGRRVLDQMTAPYFYNNGSVVRGLGWDIYSPYSSPRGSIFSAMSFGHTGYSGSSIWIDPERDLFVILLTVRYNYKDPRQINKLRSDISTLAASVFSNYRQAVNITGNM